MHFGEIKRYRSGKSGSWDINVFNGIFYLRSKIFLIGYKIHFESLIEISLIFYSTSDLCVIAPRKKMF